MAFLTFPNLLCEKQTIIVCPTVRKDVILANIVFSSLKIVNLQNVLKFSIELPSRANLQNQEKLISLQRSYQER